MSDPFSPERKTGRLKKQTLFGSGYAGLGFVERRAAGNDRPVLHGQNMHSAMSAIQILIKTVVLKELGFEQEEVARFIQRNRNYEYLKTLANAI